MDERDLYVPTYAAAAEAHPIGTDGGQNEPTSELSYAPGEIFDPFAGRQSPHEVLSEIPEDGNENLIQFGGDDADGEQDVMASQPTHPLHPSALGSDNHGNRFEVAHEPNVDELDILSHEAYKASHKPAEEQLNDIQEILTTIPESGPQPESSSPKGMRDFKEDEEETTYNRRGPLTIPQTAYDAGANSPGNKSPADEDYLPPERTHSWPRPPTPPKHLDESPEKPSVVDLGPPHHSHAARRSSEKGLHSILINKPSPYGWTWRNVDPRVLEIVYWRDPKRSAAALAAVLFALYLVSRCSVISLVAYASLAVLAGTVGFRLFKLAEAQVKKSDGSNPFKQYLEQDVEVPKEKLHTQVDIFIEHAQSLFKHLRHLFLVESIVDSVKFGLLLYTLTYVGAWFSGITLVLLFVLAVFSVPKVYELYKEPIDHYIAIAREHVEKVQHTVQDKAPFLRKILEGEKKEQ